MSTAQDFSDELSTLRIFLCRCSCTFLAARCVKHKYITWTRKQFGRRAPFLCEFWSPSDAAVLLGDAHLLRRNAQFSLSSRTRARSLSFSERRVETIAEINLPLVHEWKVEIVVPHLDCHFSLYSIEDKKIQTAELPYPWSIASFSSRL